MAAPAPAKAELAWRFAEETDAIARRGVAPDCAERMAAINARFDVECARLRADNAGPGHGPRGSQRRDQ